jgi:ferredoxin
MDSSSLSYTVTLRNRGNLSLNVSSDEPILTAFENAGYVLPVACRYGGCITCAAKLISGSVRQPNATALNSRQSREGYVLLCVARPKEDCVLDVGVETHESLYQNPFAQPTAAALLREIKDE